MDLTESSSSLGRPSGVIVDESEATTESQCSLTFHQFSDTFFSTTVHFHVLRMKDSFFLWVGTSQPQLSHLAISTMIADRVTVSNLLGEISDLTSQNLAARLAKRTKKQVLVSYNLPTEAGQRDLATLVEKRLCEEIQKHPEKF